MRGQQEGRSAARAPRTLILTMARQECAVLEGGPLRAGCLHTERMRPTGRDPLAVVAVVITTVALRP